MSAGEADAALRQFERDAVVACLALALLAGGSALAAWGPAAGVNAAGGVLCGGLLMTVSYRAIKGAADVVTAAPASLGRRALLAVKFFTRYALLAVAAYVMLTCFRLHPAGVLAGATSPFLAAVMQVGRLSRARRRHS